MKYFLANVHVSCLLAFYVIKIWENVYPLTLANIWFNTNMTVKVMLLLTVGMLDIIQAVIPLLLNAFRILLLPLMKGW